jgi:hypothetical protein
MAIELLPVEYGMTLKSIGSGVGGVVSGEVVVAHSVVE